MKTQDKHTQGPLFVSVTRDGKHIYMGHAGSSDGIERTFAECEAVEELLEACKLIAPCNFAEIGGMKAYFISDERMEKLRSAITKAEGN